MRTINKSSADWRVVEDWATAELEKHRAALEDPERDLVLTAPLQATIKILKELLALPDGKPSPPLQHGDTDYGMGTNIG